jgi:hypothetical protein
VTFAVSLLVLSLALAAGGCKDNDGKNGATATLTAEATIEATATAPAGTPAPDIRQQDFAQIPAVSDFIATAGGEVDSGAVIYADVTEDTADDAVVPISSGGEGGYIAIFVFGYGPNGLSELLRVTPSTAVNASVTEGILTVDEAQYGPGDPLCCPSQLLRTTYGWDGAQLVGDTQETVPSENKP